MNDGTIAFLVLIAIAVLGLVAHMRKPRTDGGRDLRDIGKVTFFCGLLGVVLVLARASVLP